MPSRHHKRLVALRPAGIANARAPYWRGERAETVVAERAAAIAAAKAAKKRQPRAKKLGGLQQLRDEPRPKTPNQELRRLERALKRRKTLAAQQRVAQRIKDLKRELGIR